MTEHDRNMRTLVVCFVLAIVSLTALRFKEVNNLSTVPYSQVLGETDQRVILPNADIGQ